MVSSSNFVYATASFSSHPNDCIPLKELTHSMLAESAAISRKVVFNSQTQLQLSVSRKFCNVHGFSNFINNCSNAYVERIWFYFFYVLTSLRSAGIDQNDGR